MPNAYLSKFPLKKQHFLCKNGAFSRWEELSAASHGSLVHHRPTQVWAVSEGEWFSWAGSPLSPQAWLTPTYYVQVGRVGWARVALHPGRGACLHVDERGPQAVDICFGWMASAQDHLWAHVNLKKKQETSVWRPAIVWVSISLILFWKLAHPPVPYLLHTSSLQKIMSLLYPL